MRLRRVIRSYLYNTYFGWFLIISATRARITVPLLYIQHVLATYPIRFLGLAHGFVDLSTRKEKLIVASIALSAVWLIPQH